MAKKKTEDTMEAPNVFGGFEALSKSLLGGTGSPDDNIPFIDPEDLQKDEDEDEEVKEPEVKEPKKVEKKIDEEPDESDEEELEEEEEEEEDIKASKDDDKSDEDETIEEEVVGFLKDRFSEELGWDIEEGREFESVKDVVEYMKDLVEKNSTPNYHSEDIKKLDEYVKNGGSIDKYFKEVYGGSGGMDYDNIDLTRESNQRAVVKELLKIKGYSDDKVTKALDRYEEKETLADEAEEAVELLKEYKKENAKKLLDSQQNLAKEQQKQQQLFVENVQTNIKSLENIRGIKISNKEKEELLDYIFRPDSEGLTKYQRDYMSDIKNLIESAYFTKKGDSLINEARKKGSSDAYKEFHQKIKANKGKRSKSAGNLESGSDSDILSSISKNLLKKV